MRFLLDSNAIIALLKGHPTFLAHIQRYRPADFGLPTIVVHELHCGAHRSQRVAENLERVEALPFEVVDFDREDARMAGELRARLAAAGTPIGPYDVQIAGQALARDLALVTHNVREFRRVPGLVIEDWE
ncbi:MAG: type II toxin-antitoxin system VapC family toxin [Gammaproteobacteria bacterium]|nr:type II toxin-antitoxin system VapC family toxin [Gammaproteobacteria bacterium]